MKFKVNSELETAGKNLRRSALSLLGMVLLSLCSYLMKLNDTYYSQDNEWDKLILLGTSILFVIFIITLFSAGSNLIDAAYHKSYLDENNK